MSSDQTAEARASNGARTILAQRRYCLDAGLFDSIYAPGHREDARSLLAIYAAARSAHGTSDYLEIDSHLGASLQSFVADPLCTGITSIDPRPTSQPDDRVGAAYYPHSSTARMLQHLRKVPGADLTKLQTIEASTERLSSTEIPGMPRWCFIGGEHTRASALWDARFTRKVTHDCTPPSELFVAELGQPRLLAEPILASRSASLVVALWRWVSRQRHRACTVRVLLRSRRNSSAPLNYVRRLSGRVDRSWVTTRCKRPSPRDCGYRPDLGGRREPLGRRGIWPTKKMVAVTEPR